MAGTSKYTCNKYIERVMEDYPIGHYQKSLDRLAAFPPSDPHIDTDRIYQRLSFNREAMERAMGRVLWYPEGTRIYDLLQMTQWSKTHGLTTAALDLDMLPRDAEALMKNFKIILYDELGLILP